MDMINRFNLFLVLLVFNFFYVFSNDSIAKKNHIIISFSNIQIIDDYNLLKDNMVNLQLEYDRNITEYLSIGGYVGLGFYEEWLYEKDSTSLSLTFLNYTKSIHYGLNTKLHIFSLLLKKNIPRFDLYVSAKTGIISLYSSTDRIVIPERGHYFDYALMGGGSIYLSKNFGLFVEAGYRNFKYHKGFNAKYGLTFRF